MVNNKKDTRIQSCSHRDGSLSPLSSLGNINGVRRSLTLVSLGLVLSTCSSFVLPPPPPPSEVCAGSTRSSFGNFGRWRRRGPNNRSFSTRPFENDEGAGDDNDDVSSSTSTTTFREDRSWSRRSAVARFAAGLTTLLSSSTSWPERCAASYVDPKTGVVLPSMGDIAASIPRDNDDDDGWPAEPPFEDGDKTAFARLDSTTDAMFYAEPRFVEHVDEAAARTMTDYVTGTLSSPNVRAVLDLCSSWTSHVAASSSAVDLGLVRVAGLGMNERELAANRALTEYAVADLNDPRFSRLPYDDDAFDVVLCQLSVDYLVRPLRVFREVLRVTRPGGTVRVLFSNRLFLSKAVGLWTGQDDVDHAYTVASYLRYCADAGGGGARFVDLRARDLSTRTKKGVVVGDPLFVVEGTKRA